MKKFLSVVFWLISLFSLLILNNVSFAQKDLGIDTWYDCLMGMWKNCLKYETLIWIKDNHYTTTSIAQDVVMLATYAIWTVLTIIIIYCWLMYIFAARSWKDTSSYKKWLINAWIWAVLVWWAYAIVRLIQYIAKW